MSGSARLCRVQRSARLRLGADSGGNPERGSLLLDVLIGMAIFALIALIAVSAVEGFRERAYETTATSDAQQIGDSLIDVYQESPRLTPTS